MDFAKDSLPPALGNAETEANVAGRQAPLTEMGFGQLWRKELRARIVTASSPELVLEYWKHEFESLWPNIGTFYQPLRGLRRGAVAGIDMGLGPARISTGVLIEDTSPRSFSFRSAEGHMFAGSVQFTVSAEPEAVVAKITIVLRANDPLYEVCFMLGGARLEERFWAHMLWNLADHYGQHPPVRLTRRRLDRRRHWRNATNIQHNAAIRTPVLRLRRLIRRFWSN